MTDDQLNDEILLDKIGKIPKQEIESLPKSDTIDWDENLEKETLPAKKLEFIQNRVKELASESSDADTILSKLFSEIIEAKPKHLISNIRYIQRFHSHLRFKGEVAYTLTMLIALIHHIDNLVDKAPGQSAMMYSLVAGSTAPIGNSTHVRGNITESFVTRQVNELNTIATSIFNTIGFVPRAISAAVADTLRSRTLKETPSQEDEDQKMLFRNRIMQLEAPDDLTLNDVREMFTDYKEILRISK